MHEQMSLGELLDYSTRINTFRYSKEAQVSYFQCQLNLHALLLSQSCVKRRMMIVRSQFHGEFEKEREPRFLVRKKMHHSISLYIHMRFQSVKKMLPVL